MAIRYPANIKQIHQTRSKKIRQANTESRKVIPVEAEMLKVAGLPLTTGSGNISTPWTFTAYSSV